MSIGKSRLNVNIFINFRKAPDQPPPCYAIFTYNSRRSPARSNALACPGFPGSNGRRGKENQAHAPGEPSNFPQKIKSPKVYANLLTLFP